MMRLAQSQDFVSNSSVNLPGPRVCDMTIIHSSPSASAALEQFDIKNSTAIQVGDLYFFSGMTAIDLETFEVTGGDLATQARVALENFGLMLEDMGLSLDHVIKVNAQLTNVSEFAIWNEVFLDVLRHRTHAGRPLARLLWWAISKSRLLLRRRPGDSSNRHLPIALFTCRPWHKS